VPPPKLLGTVGYNMAVRPRSRRSSTFALETLFGALHFVTTPGMCEFRFYQVVGSALLPVEPVIASRESGWQVLSLLLVRTLARPLYRSGLRWKIYSLAFVGANYD
jgi:hypothetical protein